MSPLGCDVCVFVPSAGSSAFDGSVPRAVEADALFARATGSDMKAKVVVSGYKAETAQTHVYLRHLAYAS